MPRTMPLLLALGLTAAHGTPSAPAQQINTAQQINAAQQTITAQQIITGPPIITAQPVAVAPPVVVPQGIPTAPPSPGPTLVGPSDEGVPITSLPVVTTGPVAVPPAMPPSANFSSGVTAASAAPVAALPAAVAAPAVAPSSSAARPEAAMSPEVLAMLSQTARSILLESLPERIEKNDDWGETRDRLSQLKLKNDGLKLRFEKTTKPVKHGLWKQLVVVPVEPEKNLRFRVVDARGNGSLVAFQVLVYSPLVATARVERWRTGVKLFNFSTDADATIEMRLTGELKYDYAVRDGTKYLTLAPRVTAVDMKLVEFDLRRISKAAGPLVHELGDMLSDPLADQLDKHEPKIVEKVNKSIAKRQDRLKVPVSLPFDFSQWTWGGEKKP